MEFPYALWSFPMLYGVSLYFMESYIYTFWSVILYLYWAYDVLIEISEYGMTHMIDYFYKEQYLCLLNMDL